MAKSHIALIGLGVNGSSLGLALRQSSGDFEIVGHDKRPDIANAAKQKGAVDRTEWNLHRACAGAGLIIIDGSLSELAEVLGHIAEDMTPSTVVLALSEVMQPTLEVGKSALPGTPFVVAHPILNRVGGEVEARADLFANSQFCIGADVSTPPDALELVNNLARRADAIPFFIDPTEHDGIISLLEQTPRLLAAALMQVAGNSSGWRDGQKLAGRYFANATEQSDSPEALAESLFANRENLARSLDLLETILGEWRGMLKAEESTPLQETLAAMADRRLRWERDVKLQTWESSDEPTPTEQPGLLRQMFFGDLFGGGRRRKPEGDGT